MEKNQVREEVRELLLRANPAVDVTDEDRDMFSSACGVAPRDMLFVCMELKKKYPIDYNLVVDQVKVYSLSQFTQAVYAQIHGNEL